MQIADYEKILFSIMLSTNDIKIIQQIVSQLMAIQFVYKEHRIFYTYLDDMARRELIPYELPIIYREMGTALHEVGGETYIQSLVGYKEVVAAQGTPISDFKYYVKIIDMAGKLNAIREKLIYFNGQFNDLDALVNSVDSAEGVYAKLFDELSSIKMSANSGYSHVSNFAQKAIERAKRINTGNTNILNVNFPSLYEHAIPYWPSFGAVAGRPSSGKTQFCILMAAGAATNANEGEIATIDSLETKGEFIVDRIAHAMAGTDSMRLDRNLFTDAEWGRYLDAVKFIATLPIEITDNETRTVEETFSSLMGLSLSKKIIFSVFDYIELYTDENKRSEELRLSNIVRTLKRACYKVETCGAAISQLNSEYEDRAAMIGNIENSRYTKVLFHAVDWGGVMWNAIDLVEKNKNPIAPEHLTLDHAWFLLQKHKRGKTANIPFDWISRYTRFVDYKWVNGFDMRSSHPIPQTTQEKQQAFAPINLGSRHPASSNSLVKYEYDPTMDIDSDF